MQDRYAGDVGDFGKYGLLRLLCGQPHTSRLRLGVVWCLVPCETHNQDGKHVGYLRDERRFRRCDPELFDSLQRMFGQSSGSVKETPRTIAAIESSSILPRDTLFHGAPLSYPETMPVQARLELRRRWLDLALENVAEADIVFLDPDNGIECSSVGRASLKGPKFIFWDEVEEFASLRREQSLVVYHHTNRRKASSLEKDSSYEQVEELLAEFRRRFPHLSTSAVLFTRGTRRAFFVAANERHRESIESGLNSLFESPWKEHFIRVSST